MLLFCGKFPRFTGIFFGEFTVFGLEPLFFALQSEIPALYRDFLRRVCCFLPWSLFFLRCSPKFPRFIRIYFGEFTVFGLEPLFFALQSEIPALYQDLLRRVCCFRTGASFFRVVVRNSRALSGFSSASLLFSDWSLFFLRCSPKFPCFIDK